MDKKTINYAGINYKLPEVYLLNESGIGACEYTARTCYNSFDKSENEAIIKANELVNNAESSYDETMDWLTEVNNIDNSELLDSLAWVHHHHSILELGDLTYLVKGASRGLLQEHSRHRIQSLGVRSTRYTMTNVINIFVASLNELDHNRKDWFIQKIYDLDMFVLADDQMVYLEIMSMYDKLLTHFVKVGRDKFLEMSLSKDNIEVMNKYKHKNGDYTLKKLNQGKHKRNVGDNFKGYLVTDSWKVDFVCKFNFRSLKNYFDLRDSGAAYFHIRELAKAMKDATPIKYLRLIDKNYRETKPN
jgi:thymidylate synthase (FAD)